MKLEALTFLLFLERTTALWAGKMLQTMWLIDIDALRPASGWEDVLEIQARTAFHFAGQSLELQYRLGLPVLGDPTLYPPSTQEGVNQEVV